MIHNENKCYRKKFELILCSKIVIFLFLMKDCGNDAFNLSPKPNQILRLPSASKTGLDAFNRSSFFGFSIHLKKTCVFVGAPRANSSVPEQQKIMEPGAIYKCHFDNSTRERCEPFVLDRYGNDDIEMKNHSWLGASMDGNTNDGDKLVVGN